MADVTAKMVKELRDMVGTGTMGIKKALIKVGGDTEKTVDFLRKNDMIKAAKKNDRTAAEGLANVAAVGDAAAIAKVNSEIDFASRNGMFQSSVKDTATKIAENKPAMMEEAIVVRTGKGIIESDLVEATTVIGEKINFRRSEVVEKADNAALGAYLHIGGRIAVLAIIDGTADEEVAEDIAMHIAAVNLRYINEFQTPQEKLEHEETVLIEQVLNEGEPASIVEETVVGRLQKLKAEIALVDQPSVKDPDMTVEKSVASRGGEVKSFVRLEVGKGIEKREDNFADEAISQMKS